MPGYAWLFFPGKTNMEIKLSNTMKCFKPFLFEELYRKEKAERAKGRDIISLAVGDPDIPTHESIVECAVQELHNAKNHRYPNTKGNERFRKAISAWHKRRHGLDFHYIDEISILVGSKEGIAHLPLTVMNPGDLCLIPDPTYPTYRTGVVLAGGEAYDVPLTEETGFLPDLGAIPQKIAERAKLFFLNYPNNPTGAAADIYFYRELIKWAKKNEIIIAQDAAYSDIYFTEEPAPSILQAEGARDIAVEFYSVSKSFCMAGWRAGWVVGNSKLVCALNALKENFDSGQFNAIQNAAAFGLDHFEEIVPGVRSRFKKRAEDFCNGLKKAGWRLSMPEGSCFIWAKPPVDIPSEQAVVKMLEQEGVLAAPGAGFGAHGEGYIRFSTTEPEEKLEEVIRRISRIKW